MNILLINPFVPRKIIYGKLAFFSPLLPSLGIAYLASTLIKNKHHVEIIDMNVDRTVDISEIIKKQHIDLIGVTATTIAFNSACQLIKLIKKKFPHIISVVGGAHVSALPKETLQACDYIDMGVIGEGEETLRELVSFLETKKDLKICNGIVYRKGGEIFITPQRALIKEIDTIPFPQRQLFSSFKSYYHHFLRGTLATTSIITSRGCPFGCSFCSQKIFGRNIRGHSPSYICKEIHHVKQNFKIHFFSFEDDVFNYDRNRLHSICEKLSAKRINIKWGCSIRLEMLKKEDLCWLKKAGCKKLYIGIESLNERIQTLIDKKIVIEDVIEKIKMIQNYDISINASFMLGFPSQTKKEIKNDLRMIKKLPIDGAFFCLFTPYPGTLLRKIATRFGKVSTDWNSYSNHPAEAAFISNTISIHTLKCLVLWAYVKFYFNISFLKHFFDISFLLTFLKMIFYYIRLCLLFKR